MERDKSIWLSEQSAHSRNSDGKLIPLSYNITLQHIDISLSTMKEFDQIYLVMNREDIILLKKAIEESLQKEEK